MRRDLAALLALAFVRLDDTEAQALVFARILDA